MEVDHVGYWDVVLEDVVEVSSFELEEVGK